MEIGPARTVIAIGALGSGCWALGLAARDGLRSRAASRWTRVRGRIVSAESARRSTGMHGGHGVYREGRIAYEYEWRGRTFAGRRIHAGGDVWIGSGSAEEILRRFPVGSEADVYVDPADPARSCLDPGGAAWILNAAGGALAIGFGLFLLLGGWS